MKNIVQYAADCVGDMVSLNGFVEKDWETLRAVAKTTTAWCQDMGTVYSEALHANPATAEKLANTNRMDHQQSFAVWVEKLVSGVPGDAFWPETALIGLFHATASVDNRHVVTLGCKIEAMFLDRCMKAFDSEQALTAFGAFRRVFNVATALMVDSYMHAIMLGMSDIGMNERLVGRIRTVAIRKMIVDARSTLPLIDWSDAISVHVKSIDDQHKKLIHLLNSLREAGDKKEGDETLKALLAELTQYTVEHFAHEEKLMADTSYPGLEQHKQAHAALVKQVGEINAQFQAGKARLTGDLFKFLRTWLNGHIRGTDRLYSAHMIKNGIS